MEKNEITLTLSEAIKWIKDNFNKELSISNLSYLIQYGQIRKINDTNEIKVFQSDLFEYYSAQQKNEKHWKKIYGDDLDWNLSFDNVKESERTKHVHRLHPYKGKFIPQLVEYFLDNHTDDYKNEIIFRKGDIVLDPFCGSGTTLVQANELGINAIGIDISEFNTLISNVKIQKHDLTKLYITIKKVVESLKEYVYSRNWITFEECLLKALYDFNNKYFKVPDYRYAIRNKQINEFSYSKEKNTVFLEKYFQLIKKYDLNLDEIKRIENHSFNDKWFLLPVREEIEFVKKIINNEDDQDIKNVLSIILCRTARSCRATTHSDLATLIDPINTTYYCTKHYKICKPLFSILNWFQFYSEDTVKRFTQFNKIRTDTNQIAFCGDSRTLYLHNVIPKTSALKTIIKNNGIKGIFTSPPYVGLIDYHEQHAYAYEILGLVRKDDQEIGPLYKGKGIEARKSYIKGISDVLLNCKKYLCNNYDVLIVANDSFNLYPEIANNSGMKIIKEFKRPVLNRTEKDKTAFAEKIFWLQER